MDTTILQVPISKALRVSAANVAKDGGFSSLQEVIRLFLARFAKREIGVIFEQFPAVKLSARNEKRYNKIVDDYSAGRLKTKSFDNVDKMMDYLNSDNKI